MYDHRLALVIMKGKNKQTGDKKERHAGRKNLALDLGGGMGAGNTEYLSLEVVFGFMFKSNGGGG